MAGENEASATVDEQDNDDDFNAGFTQEDAPTATPAPAPAEAAANEQSAAAEAAPEPAKKFVQVTQEDFDKLMASATEIGQIKAAHEKQFGTAFGKIGDIQRVLTQVQQATPKGQPVALDAEDFAELKKEFPELADLTFKGLERTFARLKGTATGTLAAAPAAEQAPAVAPEIIDANLNAVVKGDWIAEVNSDGYKAWIEKQADEVKALELSTSTRDAARLLRLWVAHKNSAPPAAAPAPAPGAPPATARPSTRQRQIEAAAVPRGAGGHAPSRTTEDDEFDEGFRNG